MAIKINNKDLQRRIIDGRDVQRVILNGQQIRPTSQPRINYHVVSNFSGGGGTYPGGWSGDGSAYIGGDGISSSGGQAYFDYNGFPDLSHAVKIEIIYHTYWDTDNCDTANLMGQFYYPPNGRNVGLSSYIGWSESYNTYQLALGQNNGAQGHPIFSVPSSGYYDFTWTIQLTPRTYGSTTYPGRMTWEIKDNQGDVVDTNNWMIFNQINITNLHQANDFRVMLQPGFIVSFVDFYVYNEESVPRGDGYSIPSYSDWTLLLGRLSNMGFTSAARVDEMRGYLKLPLAGYLDNWGSNLGRGDYGSYYMSTLYPDSSYDDNYYGLGIFFRPGNNVSLVSNCTAFSCTVRLFKNVPVVPETNSQWRWLYGTYGEYGIVWNPILGVISIKSQSDDDWVTISDKNRGATEVWNEGDILTDDNCGKYFQRGNCYGFPYAQAQHSGTATQVNVNGYGNGIYYTNSQFIYNWISWFTPSDTGLW